MYTLYIHIYRVTGYSNLRYAPPQVFVKGLTEVPLHDFSAALALVRRALRLRAVRSTGSSSIDVGYAPPPHLYEQALVCLFNREILDASRGRPFHCKIAINCFFKYFGLIH